MELLSQLDQVGKQVLLLRNDVAEFICNLPPPVMLSMTKTKSYEASRGYFLVNIMGMCGPKGMVFSRSGHKQGIYFSQFAALLVILNRVAMFAL